MAAHGDLEFLGEMFLVWRSLAKQARRHKGTRKGDAYTTAMDLVQYFIEDQPDGREFFWEATRVASGVR